jgi:flagellar L-ring protein FlgH
MSRRNVIFATATLSLGGGVFAQTATSSPSGTRAPDTQLLMQASGGSLMQASMTESSDPNVKTPSYNMLAVSEPEPKVLRKHDLVSIVVQEISSYQSTGDTNEQKNADFDAKVDQWIKLNLGQFSVHGTGQANNPVEMKLEGERDFKGTAAMDRSDTETLRVEAEVIDVKPNGTLVLQARKHIKNDEEDQTIILTGTCRVQDIDASNSVLSTDLHDLDLQKVTKGMVRDGNKRGWLPRILDWLNPW